MKRTRHLIGWVLMAVTGMGGPSLVAHPRLAAVFADPPHEAKPRGYWLWAHGNFDYRTIRRDLEEFAGKGLGGVDIFDIGIADPLEVIPSGPAFLSPEQVDGMAFALGEAQRLGLRMGLIVSSSWNAGGPWIEPEHGVMTLLERKAVLTMKAAGEAKMAFPEIPETFAKPYGVYRLNVPLAADGLPRYRREVALLAYPVEGAEGVLDPQKVERLEGKLEADGSLSFPLGAGTWAVHRFVQTSFGQGLFVPSDNSKGLIADHFSAAATDQHFGVVIGRLKERLGDLRGTALERFYLASFEAVAKLKWTTAYSAVFREMHGYDPEPYLPALTGSVVGSKETGARFEHDYLATISEMFIHNHYRRARDLAHREGILIASEAGGPGPPLHDVPTEDLKALGSLDVMRGEFWNRELEEKHKDSLGLNILQVVKNIASAAHIYGHRVVEMEAFTSSGPHWEEGPVLLKALADRAFCEGMTRVVYHTMPHNPAEAGTPGWSFQAGTHVGPGMAWWELSQPFHAYLARCSAMLQEGQFVADAAYFYGSKIPNFAHPKHVRPGLGYGYDYDDLNTEVFLQEETRVDEEGRVVLKSGMRYPLLVLPEDDRMEVAVAAKLLDMVAAGATVIGPRPRRVYGLADYENREKELQRLAEALWGPDTGTTEGERRVGKGRIVWGKAPRAVLQGMGMGPDVGVLPASAEGGLDWIHRRIDEADFYFVRNTRPEPATFEVTLRDGAGQPEWWNPVTGGRRRMAVAEEAPGNGVTVRLELRALEAGFVVFTDGASGRRPPVASDGEEWIYAPDPGESRVLADLSGDWKVAFPAGWGAPARVDFPELISWTAAEEPGVRGFSGTAVYRKNFQLGSGDWDRSGGRVVLDLGEAREVCRVFLNGVEVGTGWFPPLRWEVTGLLRAGDNHLVVEVANTWLNRMVADAALSGERPYTQSNVATRTAGKPVERPWARRQPAVSGLLGPVRLEILQAGSERAVSP